MPYRIDHVHLRSRDAVAASVFYVEKLGAREIRRDGAPVTRVVLDLGGLHLFIEQAPEDTAPGAKAPHLGLEHIGFAVDDIEATFAELKAKNLDIVSGINDVKPGLRTIFITGPDGVLIEFLKRDFAL
jgi:catechol 2,3-dioxygenase-like lactoylglutathione lyase family enzyme